MPRVRSLPFLLLLSLLFAFAQAAAVLHTLSHDNGADTQQQHKHLPGAKVCEKCVVFAKFSGAIASPSAHIDLSAAPADFPLRSHRSTHRQFIPAYLSRAPPIQS